MNSGRCSARAAWMLAAGVAATALTSGSPAGAQDAPAGNRPPEAAADAPLPATTPMTELLTRMDALEGQVARLTAQNEELANRQHQLETKLASADTRADAVSTLPAAPAPDAAKSANAANLAAMTDGAAAAADHPAGAAGPSRPSAQRVAAVRAVIKPQTDDAALDDYTYGFRLYTAKFYPEAAQQLKIYIDKYPKDAHISHARNLLGRAYLDDGKPREAAPWFLLNYKTDPQGARAPDSLLNLAAAMRQSGYEPRACIALNEFAATYAAEAKGRLHDEYAKTRDGLTCN